MRARDTRWNTMRCMAFFFVSIAALGACGKKAGETKKDGPSDKSSAADEGAVEKKTPFKATFPTTVSVDGAFDDEKVQGKKVKLISGRAVTLAQSIGIELSDKKLECDDDDEGAFVLTIDLPAPAGDFAGPLTYGTFVSHYGHVLDDQVLAKPDEATVTLTAYGAKAGARITGSLDFGHHHEIQKSGGGKRVESYEGKGTFDVVLCPDKPGRFPQFKNTTSVPREPLDHAQVEGKFGGKPFVAKTVLARLKFIHPDVLEALQFFEDEVTCETREAAEDKVRWIGVQYPGLTKDANHSGSLHPVAVDQVTKGVSHNVVSESYLTSPRGWVRLAPAKFPLGKTIQGAIVIASGSDDDADSRIDIGGKFTAIVCSADQL